MDRSAGSPRTRSVVGVRGPGVSVFGLPEKMPYCLKEQCREDFAVLGQFCAKIDHYFEALQIINKMLL